ncbi:hypothetical protein [Latilactobacillus curvatus]
MKKLNIKRLTNGFLILMIILLSYKVFWIHIGIFLKNNSKVFSNSFFVVFTILVICVISIFNGSFRIKKFLIGTSLLFLILILFFINSNLPNDSSNSLAQSVRIYGYLWVFLFLYIGNISVKDDAIAKIVLWSAGLSGTLGIIQATLKRPLVATQYQQVPFLNSIYYWNGHSASTPINQVGMRIRGFGLTDSGLTLGIVLLCAFCVGYYYLEKSKKKSIILSIFLLGIVCTITRNVYIATVLAILLMIFNKHYWYAKAMKTFYLLLTIIGFISIYADKLLDLLSSFFSSYGIVTFSSRYYYINIALEQVSDMKHFLFGANVVTHDGLPIDNGIVATIVDKGFIFYVVVQIIFLIIIFKGIDSNNKITRGLVIFCMTYPVVSFANSVDIVYGYFFILLFLSNKFENKNRRKSS